MKKLSRFRQGQMLGGVCMGLARYFDIDVSIVRLAWVIVGFMGAGVPAYVIAWIIIPEDPGKGDPVDVTPTSSGSGVSTDNRTVGMIIVAVGIYLLLRVLIPRPFFHFYFWPVALISVGLFVMFGGLRGRNK